MMYQFHDGDFTLDSPFHGSIGGQVRFGNNFNGYLFTGYFVYAELDASLYIHVNEPWA